jgi:hypothetical protein
MPLALIVALAVAPAPVERSFALEAPSEVVATVTAGCRGCDWARRGLEAAALELRVDGRYSQHLLLTRGERTAAYRVGLGSFAAGRHRLSAVLDPRQSARRVRAAEITGLDVDAFDPATPEELRLAHAPILEARRSSIGKFTDVHSRSTDATRPPIPCSTSRPTTTW